MYKPITSFQNSKIKKLSRLKNRNERDRSSLFLIEGYRELKRASEGGVDFDSLFISPELFLGNHEGPLIKAIGAENFQLPPLLFKKISYRDRPDGLIGVAKQMRRQLQDLHPKNQAPLYVVAESIEKPGNLGTILRSSDGAGADAVIVCDRCTDIYNPNVVRASVGTLFTLPVIESTGEESYLWLKKRGVQIVAATPSAVLRYTEAPLAGPLAVVFGTEQLGLSDFWMKRADIRVKIPMLGKSDSLNVAMATTLILYEVMRQRAL